MCTASDIMRSYDKSLRNNGIGLMNRNYLWFILFVILSPVLHAAESAVFSDLIEINESGHKVKYKRVKEPSQDAIDNSQAEAGEDMDIKAFKNSYISPYNYTQDPIAYNMGTSSVAGPNGTYHVGLSQISTTNINLNSQNAARFDETVEAWGQTQRWGGFALGGALQSGVIMEQTGQPNTYGTTGIIFPTQAYADWEYKDAFEITGGNILLTTPWVNSISSFPGATYANQNNTFQGLTANLQVMPNLLLTGFRVFSYLQFPDNGFSSTTLYNTMGGPLQNMGSTSTPGATGAGATWNPSSNYTLNAWFYQFYDYADMWYADNNYHLPLSTATSFDFGVQALTQNANGSSIPANTLAPSSSTQNLGGVNGNAVGMKFAVNVGHNTVTLAYNNVFGANGSYLNGGIVTPYTFGLETDPLYTTPALNSIAELGSGSAYLIKDSMSFLDNSLKASLAFSQFFVNQVYATQANQITEYDAALQYTIPNTTLNFWSRLVYVSQPDYAGGSFLQPRLIVNYTF